MQISMIGIDHSKAPLAVREKFSFTKAMASRASISLKEGYGLAGCMLISTCNRTELWIASDEKKLPKELKPSERLSDMLCSMKGVSKEEYSQYFNVRYGRNAVNHMLRLACGLDSRIFGEDQIISQVREALELGRSAKTMGSELDRLFQTAVTAGKHVKTMVKITNVNQSSAVSIIEKLNRDGVELKGLKCLVIGNGKMGKLVSNALVAAGAKVSMTLRRKMHNNDEQNSIVPFGCDMISYDERMEELPKNQVVVSATISPHYTVTKRAFEESRNKVWGEGKIEPPDYFHENSAGEKIQYMFDLAVPRDIQEAIAQEENIKLFDIDSLVTDGANSQNAGGIELAEKILADYENKFEDWLKFREILQTVNFVTDKMESDLRARVLHVRKSGEITESCGDFADLISAGGRSAKKFVFEMLKELDAQHREACLAALCKAANRESKRS